MRQFLRKYLVDHPGIQVGMRVFFIVALLAYFQPPEMIFTALCLSLLGDLILIKEGFVTLVTGLVAFLAAHVFYIYHFANEQILAPLHMIPTEHSIVLATIFMVAVFCEMLLDFPNQLQK